MTDRFLPFRRKMEDDGLSEAAIRAFEHCYRALERDETGKIGESTIAPVLELPQFAELPDVPPQEFRQLLQETAIIKLNGGLGTGMGLAKAKSLLKVRDGLTFLDLIAKQVLHLRASAGGESPHFLLMNSFSTSSDTKLALAAHPSLGNPDDLEFMQSRVPRVLAETLAPLSWPQNPSLEWCPPGHGDIYPSLLGSGALDRMLEAGIMYAFVSNSDNLGADLHPSLLGWFARSGRPFVMEVTRRTPQDSKGGHLAQRRSDGRLILREIAQCASEDEAAFEDIHRHQFFNTNNLWLRLDRLKATLEANGGALLLPLIRNEKTADPRDAKTPKVYQLETAMGAAIECFDGASAIEVPRTRFVPVKTTSDLLIVRSNACILTDDFRIELHPARKGRPPHLSLDPAHYKLVDGLERLLAHGVPDLLECDRLTITGLLQFGPQVHIKASTVLTHSGPNPAMVPPGIYEGRREIS